MLGERVAERPDSTACRELTLLGGFHLRCRGQPLTPPPSAQRLLALHERALTRRYIAGTLWLNSTDHHANGDLRSTLWRLRKTDPHLIHHHADRLALHPHLNVDVHRMLHTSRHLHTHHTLTPLDIDTIDEDLFTHDLLPDWYDDWLLLERERLRHIRLQALETLADHHLDHGDHPAALRTALAAVHSEPLRESSQRILIRTHLATGNYSEALRQYHHYQQLLTDELGLQPSPLMQNLIAPLTQH